MDKSALSSWGVEFEEGGHSEAAILSAEAVIKSPGIPHTAPIIERIKETDKPLMGELIGPQDIPLQKLLPLPVQTEKRPQQRFVTIIISAQYDTVLAGNVGLSLGRALAQRLEDGERDPEVIVLEVSSFQLDDALVFEPHISILTNITPDHLDRYNYDINAYARSKFQLLDYTVDTGHFIYCDDDKVSMEFLKKWQRTKNIKATLFAVGIDAPAGPHRIAQLNNNKITITLNNKAMTIEELAMQGKHNTYNGMAAGLSAQLLKVRNQTIREKLQSFDALEHRLESVLNISGVEYINDSKATNVNATYYALECQHKPVVWIVGGVDKGNDYNELIGLVENKVKSIVALGVDNSKIMEAFGSITEVIEADSMKSAVRKAAKLAKKGDAVLLSPCCASFDLFENFEDRGNQFKTQVRNL